jgi:hypothetical protein
MIPVFIYLIVLKEVRKGMKKIIVAINRAKNIFWRFKNNAYLRTRKMGKSYTTSSLGIPQGLTAARVRRL